MFRKMSGTNHSKGAEGVSLGRTAMKRKGSHKHKHKHRVGISRSINPPVQNIVGCRVKHKWKEDCYSPASHWTGTVLEQIPVNPSLYLIKYDGFDCVYGMEILRDERVQDLEIMPGKIDPYRISDAHLAERILGRTVEHQFQTEDGSKNGWKGLVLGRAPLLPTWFFITYEKDPVLYMYQLLEDYEDGDLKILQDGEDSTELKDTGEAFDSLVGRQVDYEHESSVQRTGTVIYQVQAKPSIYFIKFDDDHHIYVYDMV